MDAARAAAAVGQRLPPVRPCAVIRIPRVGSPEAERLQCRFHRYLHGTAQAPLPAAVQAARQEEVDRYRRGLAAALQHVASPRDRALLQLLHSGGAYFEVFCCQEALRAVVEVPAAAEIRIAACLGPATSAAAADVAVAAQALSFRGHAASCRLQGRWRRKPCPSEATVWWRREHGANPMGQPEEQESAWSAARRAWREFRGAEAAPEEQIPKPEAGWPAVQRLWRHMLGSGQMRGEQVPEVPGELAEGWKAVLAAVGVGALRGGVMQWDAEKQRAMQTLLIPRPLAHRSLTPKVACLLRMSDAVLRSSLAWGGLLSLGLGVHALCVVYRGRRVWGVDGAAAAAVATAAGAAHHLSRSVRTWPLQKPVAGHIQGMTVTFFVFGIVLDQWFGLMEADEQRKAEEAAKVAAEEEEKQRRAEAAAAARERDVAAELLAQLEAAQRGKAGGGAAAEAQLQQLQQQRQPG
ncbi:ABC transporter permease [Chlorella sorokiniana]|uniref:ABC transporter permease n=1 Tax=Chlorella sorokiniana TaxID=3076 RepID=A0A2P6TEK6_CHLSO|nr:ABC transporter permease [Chlorella sorokiniana]|eukprot:PRW21075.1 ABC transporter permease [Chlorella sorokiniana]